MIYADSVAGKKDMNEVKDDFFAEFNLYTQMAHFVGKVLHIRPNEILDTWGVAELIVAYGEYANDISKENFEEWKQLDAKDRTKIKQPKECIVEFHGLSTLGDNE